MKTYYRVYFLVAVSSGLYGSFSDGDETLWEAEEAERMAHAKPPQVRIVDRTPAYDLEDVAHLEEPGAETIPKAEEDSAAAEQAAAGETPEAPDETPEASKTANAEYKTGLEEASASDVSADTKDIAEEPLPDWPHNMAPDEYLKRYPDQPEAALARKILGLG